jgi:hypothetical protein
VELHSPSVATREALVRSSDGAEVLEEIKTSLSRRNSIDILQIEEESAGNFFFFVFLFFEAGFFCPPLENAIKAAHPVEPQNNRAKFQRKFYSLIIGTLSTAAKSSGVERSQILIQLLKNLSAKIEPKVIAYFLSDGSIKLGQHFGNRHYFNLACQVNGRIFVFFLHLSHLVFCSGVWGQA